MSYYPWKQIAQFHREIGVRSEESFFTFKCDDTGSERFSFVRNSVFEKTQINPEVSVSDFSNRSVFTDIEQKNNEFFIGGLFWFSKQNVNGNWITYCHPVIYKPYHVYINESNNFTFEPLQSDWDVSPVFLKLLEKRGIVADGNIETEIKAIVEKAEESKPDNKRLGLVFASLLTEKYPELEREFNSDAQKHANTDWLVFSAPKDYSAIMKNLIADYDKLIDAIDKNPDEIGGFNLFEHSNTKAHRNDAQIEPIVPLNENQMKVVNSVISGNEITVVSGPPGCGKSQVVLSILLNAWKSNKSVLFASSNNQAVDVIRARIKKYEHDIPLVVRTGSKRNSELLPSLERMSIIIDNYVPERSKGLDKDIEKYRRNYEKYDDIIKSNIPQQVNELYKSALSSFSTAESLKAQADEIVRDYHDELHSNGFITEILTFNKDVFVPFFAWKKDHELMLDTIKSEDEVRNTLYLKLVGLNFDIKEKTHKYYTKDTLPCDVKQIQLFNDWYTEFKAFMSGYSNADFQTVTNDMRFRYWYSASDAGNWIMEADNVLAKIDAFYKNFMTKAEEINREKTLHKETVDALSHKGVKPLSKEQVEYIGQWKKIYNEYILLPDSSFPFSKKKKLSKKLHSLEVVLLDIFDNSVISEVSSEPEKLREIISGSYDDTIKEYEERQNIGSYKYDIEVIQKHLNEINDSLSVLNIQRIEKYIGIGDTKTVVSEKVLAAKDAFVYYTAKEKQEDFLVKVKEILGNGAKILYPYTFELDENSEIEQFYIGISSNAEDSAPSVFTKLSKLIASGAADRFVLDLTAIYKIQNEADNTNKKLEQVCPPERRKSVWLNKCPKAIRNNNLTYEQVLALLPQWERDINVFHEDTEKDKQRMKDLLLDADKELKWAEENLNKAILIVPDELLIGNKKSIKEHIAKKEYDAEYIAKAFSKIEINTLTAARDNIKNSLDGLILSKIKEEKISSICSDISVKVAVQSAIMEYKVNGEYASNKLNYSFNDVLKALPLWITTGNSPQSIPMQPDLFDILIIDEATQCTITSVLPLIYRCKQIVVIGDVEQLPSIDNITLNTEKYISSHYGIENYLTQLGHCGCNIYKSVLRLLPQKNGSIYSLTDHYRSHPLIIGFSNNFIYKNKLVLKKPMKDVDLNNVFGIFGIDVPGNALRDKKTDSWYNKEEANQVVQLILQIRDTPAYENLSVGVITPFRGQVEYISDLLNRYSLSVNISVSTVHKYQGDERDIIIFSPVVSNGMSDGAAKWVQSPPNLINVALTRAREALFVVSDFKVCRRQQGILGNLIQYIEKVELLRKTSLFELQLFGMMVLQNWKIDVHPRINDIEIDFIVHNEKNLSIAVEVDGTQHQNQQILDAGRDALIRSKGIDVIRITTKEISDTPLETISRIQSKFDSLIS